MNILFLMAILSALMAGLVTYQNVIEKDLKGTGSTSPLYSTPISPLER
jgi:hypothetical protein